MKISGVYSITNNVTGELYIGSSKDIKKRWYSHRSPSAWKKQPNLKLYQDMAQYGRDNFIFEVIEETTNLREREQYWIEQLKPSYNSFWAYGYNEERWKETHKRCNKEWYEIHHDDALNKSKAYRQAHRDEKLAKNKANYSRLCFYEGETLTLSALTSRFHIQGIPHAWTEAKKYLIQE